MRRSTKTILAALVVAAAPPVLTPAFAETDAVEASEETVLASGEWTKKSYRSKGGWSIVQRGDKRYVVLDDGFSTRNAPDLKIFLSPSEGGALNGRNATDGAVLISPLSSNKGAQEYEIPADVNLDDFASIIIHCQAFSKLWSVAAL